MSAQNTHKNIHKPQITRAGPKSKNRRGPEGEARVNHLKKTFPPKNTPWGLIPQKTFLNSSFTPIGGSYPDSTKKAAKSSPGYAQGYPDPCPRGEPGVHRDVGNHSVGPLVGVRPYPPGASSPRPSRNWARGLEREAVFHGSVGADGSINLHPEGICFRSNAHSAMDSERRPLTWRGGKPRDFNPARSLIRHRREGGAEIQW